MNINIAEKWKKYLFLAWLLASVAWVPVAGKICHMKDVAARYRVYNNYENQIAHGNHSDYLRTAYRNAATSLDNSSQHVGSFLIIGFGLPGLILAGGTWLLRRRERPH